MEDNCQDILSIDASIAGDSVIGDFESNIGDTIDIDDDDVGTVDSEEDDGINIIIECGGKSSKKPSTEIERIDNILQQVKFEDDELQNEIGNLITKSFEISMSKFITVFVDNRFIILNHETPISDRLRSCIWKVQHPYIYKPFFYINSLNNIIKPNMEFPDTYAVFAVKYEKVNKLKMLKSVDKNVSTTRQHYTKINNALYVYTDFAILIIKNHKIVDYAIHGVHSNIHEAVDRWKPQKIYYNAQPNDPLDTFLSYKYQPFYDLIQKYGDCMKIYRNQNVVSLALCERNDIFCALCNSIKDFLGLTNYYNTTKNQMSFTSNCKTKNQMSFAPRCKPLYRYNPYKQPQNVRRALSVMKKN